jgi:hypothetical protein
VEVKFASIPICNIRRKLMASLKELLDKLDEVLDAFTSRIGVERTVIIASGGTVSEAVDLGGHFAYLQVEVPAIDSAQLELQVSDRIDGTYQDFGQNALTDTSIGAYSDTWILGGWRYIKIKASAAQDTGVRVFKVRGITY